MAYTAEKSAVKYDRKQFIPLNYFTNSAEQIRKTLKELLFLIG